jgi:hypothetical protein
VGGTPESDNLAHLLTDVQAASFVGLPPHDGGVLSSYIDGIRGLLDRHSQSQDGICAERGDAEAARKIAGELNGLQDSMRHALVTGKLFAFWPQSVKAT